MVAEQHIEPASHPYIEYILYLLDLFLLSLHDGLLSVEEGLELQVSLKLLVRAHLRALLCP